ncbi:hypothetical protein IEQ34_017652 [Dendrobium chrysotoxum]|uniref:Uncharacterized protein n=1 Tax=Dendrobium chrysotoxum TaxID=161865 RepID=A0AAV7GC88_DENCH|nr:hypothetical protein IEQ34_017652 [Dendrobium chrysotoxum]
MHVVVMDYVTMQIVLLVDVNICGSGLEKFTKDVCPILDHLPKHCLMAKNLSSFFSLMEKVENLSSFFSLMEKTENNNSFFSLLEKAENQNSFSSLLEKAENHNSFYVQQVRFFFLPQIGEETEANASLTPKLPLGK